VHELSIAQDLLKIVLEHARKHGAGSGPDEPRVCKVNLKIGALTQIVPDSLTLCFKICAEGTAAQGAEVEIEACPLRLKCRQCGEESETEGPFFLCPKCDSPDVDVLSGRELMVTSLTIDD